MIIIIVALIEFALFLFLLIAMHHQFKRGADALVLIGNMLTYLGASQVIERQTSPEDDLLAQNRKFRDVFKSLGIMDADDKLYMRCYAEWNNSQRPTDMIGFIQQRMKMHGT